MFEQLLVPRVPFTAAELVVDFVKIDDHIVGQRKALEERIQPAVRRYAESVILHRGIPGMAQLHRLEERLQLGLAHTFVFGFREATSEIRRLRDRKADRPTLVGWEPPPQQPWNAGTYVQRVAVLRVHEFNDHCVSWYARLVDADQVDREAFHDRCRRAAHNMVLDLVGQVLNAGRSLAATGGSRPTFTAAIAMTRWAMRSEQLDTNTCIPCENEHGQVYEVASPDYFLHMPPAGCRGGGRCRGIYVYADEPDDFNRPSRLF